MSIHIRDAFAFTSKSKRPFSSLMSLVDDNNNNEQIQGQEKENPNGPGLGLENGISPPQQQQPPRQPQPKRTQFNATESSIPIAYKPGTWNNALRALGTAFQRLEAEEREAKQVHLRTDASNKAYVTRKICNGDKILSNLEKDLNNMGIVRTEHQKQMHKFLTMSQLRFIFGKDFASNQARLLKMFKVKKFPKAALMTTPRQFGKTVGKAAFDAAGGRNIPNWTSTTISPGRRQSDNMRDIAYDFACSFPDGRDRTHKRGEKIFIYNSAAAASSARGSRKKKGGKVKTETVTVSGLPIKTLDGSKSLAQILSEEDNTNNKTRSKLEYLPSNEKGRVYVLLVCFLLIGTTHDSP